MGDILLEVECHDMALAFIAKNEIFFVIYDMIFDRSDIS
jgi:hypothetical protein